MDNCYQRREAQPAVASRRLQCTRSKIYDPRGKRCFRHDGAVEVPSDILSHPGELRSDGAFGRTDVVVLSPALTAWLWPRHDSHGFLRARFGRGRPLPSGSIATVPLSSILTGLEHQ